MTQSQFTLKGISPLDIHFYDDDVVVVCKPAGLLSVPGREERDCVLARLAVSWPGVLTVHRLDMETSGLMVYALNKPAQRALSIAFQDRLVNKVYGCLIYGRMETAEGEISLPLRCDWPNRPRQIIDWAQGKPALTRWRVEGREQRQGTDISRMTLMPVTGRSHQLRVHMMALGCPILGDSLYAEGRARSLADRLCLHAAQLSFAHPVTGEQLSFTDPVPF